MRPRVLFLCTGNSCRSQIAEGLARQGGLIDAASAGTNPQGLNPLAIRAMSELGMDISHHTSKHLDSLRGQHFDLVITVCDSAREACPTLPGTRTLHVPFDDPPRLAADATSDDEALPHYRRVRDQIHAFIQSLPTLLNLQRTQP